MAVKRAKKKVSKKFKKTKLEERIAPCMSTGMDPSIAEGLATPSEPADEAPTHSGGEVDSTQVESTEPSSEYLEDTGGDGNYTEQKGPDMETAGESGTHQDMSQPTDDYSKDEFDDHEADDAESKGLWQEADFVSETPDGGAHITFPDGVSFDDNVASFPIDVANETLPIPEDVSITPEGGLSLQAPEGTVMNEDANMLVFPEGTVDPHDVPEQFDAYKGPDGSTHVPLPEQGISFDPEANTINIDNHWANEMAPENISIEPNGTVNVEFPEEHTTVNEDGSITVSGDGMVYMDGPPPDEVDVDWGQMNSDGSMTFDPPEGIEVEGGVMNISHEALDQIPIPDEVSVNPDGSMSMPVPEGTNYNPDTGTLSFSSEHVHLDDIPEGIDAYPTPTGEIEVILPEGISYSAESGEVTFDNEWANSMCPDNIQINPDGSVDVALPEDTQYHEDGTFTIPEESVDFMDDHRAEYVDDVEWSEQGPNGEYHMHPPAEMTMHDGELKIPHDSIDEHVPMPDNVSINPDGSIEVALPDGTQYNAEDNSLTFKPGEMKLDEIPEGINAHANPDGSVTAYIPEGMEYNSDTGGVHMNNYWANEVAPGPVEIAPDGSMNIELPSNTDYHPDGSFTIPPENADFMENPEPSYVTDGPDYCYSNPDGSVSFALQDGMETNPDTGTLSMPTHMMQNEFNDFIPEGAEFHPDGTMTMPVPENTQYSEEYNSLTFAEGTIHPNEVPEDVETHTGPDGQVTVILPEGVGYDADTGSVKLDNYWTNQVTPDPVHVGFDGNMEINLPSDTHFDGEGNFTISADSTDFMEHPAPDYVAQGPDWVEGDGAGGVSVHPPEGVHVDVDEGKMYIPGDQIDDFPHPPELHFDSTGDVKIDLPEGTSWDPNSFSLTLPPDAINPNEIPGDIDAQVLENGSIQVNLPPNGFDYNPDTGQLEVSNQAFNTYLAPDNVELTGDGQVSVDLPHDTHYYDNGDFRIPPDSADFMDNPSPDYVDDSPEWVSENPDGSVHIAPPDGAVVDSEALTVTFPYEMASENFPIPEDVTLNSDGSIDIKLPENASYEDGVLKLPGDGMSLHDVPPGVEASLDGEGNINIVVPEGIEVDMEGGSIHLNNAWANEMAPGPIQINPDGSLQIEVPEGTQFHDDGSFTIPEDKADFMDDDVPEYAHNDFVEYQGDGHYHVNPPDGMSVNMEEGTAHITHEAYQQMHHADDFHLNPDGSANVDLPPETTYDQVHNAVILPPNYPINDIPQELDVHINDDGSIKVGLMDGMEYDSDANQVKISNELLNQFAPPPVEFTPDGSVNLQLPLDTTYYPDGSVSTGQMDYYEPQPMIQVETPDGTAVNYNPTHNEYHPQEEEQPTEQYGT